MKLLIGTKNPGKLREMQSFLGDAFELLSLADVPHAPDIAETGTTFEENAILKARAYFDFSGIPTIADDGGLEITTLNGEPGVYSRRWPGYEATDDELIDMALAKLKGKADRSAHLRVVGAYYDGTHTLTATAAIEGIITDERPASCESGYPFRSIFLIPKFGKLFCNLTPQEHEQVNHRRMTYTALRDRILHEAAPVQK